MIYITLGKNLNSPLNRGNFPRSREQVAVWLHSHSRSLATFFETVAKKKPAEASGCAPLHEKAPPEAGLSR